MELFTFPVSGVETYLWVPLLAGFALAFFCAMGGLTGAFLLLPFQISVLGYVGPGVSATNHLYNVFSIPGGVYTFIRDRRLVWSLTLSVVAGSVPGVIAGGFIRLTWLSNPGPFKAFVGFVLLLLAWRMLQDARRSWSAAQRQKADKRLNGSQPVQWHAEVCERSIFRLCFTFQGQTYACNPFLIFLLGLAAGTIGGIYGVGGGSIVVPFLVTVWRLPIHVIAGSTLLSTFATSATAVLFFQITAPYYPHLAAAPDWMLGCAFGLGGLLGGYLGAKFQKKVSADIIKIALTLMLLYISLSYLWTTFAS